MFHPENVYLRRGDLPEELECSATSGHGCLSIQFAYEARSHRLDQVASPSDARRGEPQSRHNLGPADLSPLPALEALRRSQPPLHSRPRVPPVDAYRQAFEKRILPTYRILQSAVRRLTIQS